MSFRNDQNSSFVLKGVIVACVIGAILFVPALAGAEVRNQVWSAKMQGLYRTLAALMTDVMSSKRFNDPANENRIKNEAEKIASLAHDLSENRVVVPDSDPTLRIMAGMLSEESKRAALELKRGNRTYARSILRTIPGYCIACHTRNSSGPRFERLPVEPIAKNSLSPIEWGEFFAATRQFDRAQARFIEVINNAQLAKNRPLEWARSVHQDLAIAVRVKRDPAEALRIVKSVLASSDAPGFLKEDALQWKASIQNWNAELPRIPQTEEGLHAELIRLMAGAHEIQKYPADRSADIDYLRASAVAHDLLQLFPNGKYADESLFMAGICYEVLYPVDLEDLHELFYEACIRRSPHTGLAENCYHHLEQSTFFDYTGSGGMNLPTDVRERLVELGGLATPVLPVRK